MGNGGVRYFGWMGVVDAVFVLTRLQGAYHAGRERLCVYFVNLGGTFGGVPGRVV